MGPKTTSVVLLGPKRTTSVIFQKLTAMAFNKAITTAYLLCLLLHAVTASDIIEDDYNSEPPALAWPEPTFGNWSTDSDGGMYTGLLAGFGASMMDTTVKKPKEANDLEKSWKFSSPPAAGPPEGGKGVFYVTKYGAKGDGKTDNTEAFMDTWKSACGNKGETWMVVPEGEFLIGELNFEGPCENNNSPFKLYVKGTLKATIDLNKYSKKELWIQIKRVTGLDMFGGGTFDGQGDRSWEHNECEDKKECNMLPATIKLIKMTDTKVGQLSFLNSKGFHIHYTESEVASFYDLKIIAPNESPNTDGIHVSACSKVNISNAFIGTGDDCISIGDGTTNLSISNVFCGPGHGISIGSLGKYADEKPVDGIYATNCTLSGTDNGLRIKTWPGSPPGSASNFVFEDIVMNRVSFPIIIDQDYCPDDSCSRKPGSKVQISNILYKNIRGTSFTKLAVKLFCSKTYPCKNVKFEDIDITYQDPESPTVSLCQDIEVVTQGKQVPTICRQS